MFLDFAQKIAKLLGSPLTFILSLLVIVVWGISGFFLDFNDTWQLIINTLSTIVTFLAVIILQHSTNHSEESIHSKLNEIIALLNKSKLTKEEQRILEEHHEELIEDAIEQAKIENEEAALEDQNISD